MTDDPRPDSLAASAAGDSVTADALGEPAGDGPLHRLLGADERPQYLLRGHILDIVDLDAPESDPGRRSRKVAAAGVDLRTLVTDDRVLSVVPRSDGIERLSVPYPDVSGVDTEAGPGGARRLRVFAGDTAYYLDASGSDAREIESAAGYVADRDPADGSADADADADVGASADDGGNSEEVLDTVERLADLHERGVLSEEEFEQKKGDLLDRL